MKILEYLDDFSGTTSIQFRIGRDSLCYVIYKDDIHRENTYVFTLNEKQLHEIKDWIEDYLKDGGQDGKR